ncbi:GDP-L-fucose synthase [Oryzomonas japonica]|uniref:GDP-L-fucose synthase n=1 Tax=Oryzomonas japonica TaxID=2603858 RepID=A0A7J4ZTM2_9BACT|nr:GDP-L-fucose synthase [Oryzomonas japonica]KAB0666155.1 GDP-L-fucose synthase [Oryzomonas japonica]
MNPQDKIYVAGHRGMVGSAIVRRLQGAGYTNLVLPSRAELDLCNQAAVAAFFRDERPEYVFLAAAKVGGIVANSTQPGQFIYENLMIQNNIVHGSWNTGVKRLLFLGSTCIYPKLAPQPLKEEYLLTGPLEPTNDAYAVAKIAGITMCRSFNRQYGTRYLAAMPTNLYGINDNFDLVSSHVLPAMIRKFHEAKERGDATVTIWGSGTPLREFLHVDDLADGCLHLINLPEAEYGRLLDDPAAPALINIGSGEELTIRELALVVKKVVGFAGDLAFDPGKPDGTPRKLCDVSRLHALGWRHHIGLEDGLAATYRWYREMVGREA